MSKLIDAEKLKAYIASKFVAKRKTKMHYYEDALEIMEMVDKQDEVLLSCPKCHGAGAYDVPKFDDETYMPSETEWESRHCELCYGTGKVTLEFYEDIQKRCRR